MWKVIIKPMLEEKFSTLLVEYKRFLRWRGRKKSNPQFTELFWLSYFDILRRQKRNSMIRQCVWRLVIGLGLIVWLIYGSFHHYGTLLKLMMLIAIVIDLVYVPKMLWSTRDVFWEAEREAAQVVYDGMVAKLRVHVRSQLTTFATGLKQSFSDPNCDGVKNIDAMLTYTLSRLDKLQYDWEITKLQEQTESAMQRIVDAMTPPAAPPP